MLIELLKFLDLQCFLWLNGALNNRFAQYFWGVLSHKNESWINVIVMIAINILAVFMLTRHKRLKAFYIVLYCWISFQLVLLTNSLIFQKILHIHRDSPSVVVDNIIKLSTLLNNPNLKDYSNNSFPAGHALVLMYWALFLQLYANRTIKLLSGLLCILFIMPRMIAGAHWFSDTLCSLVLGYIYFKIAIWLLQKYTSFNHIIGIVQHNEVNEVNEVNEGNICSI